MMFLVKAGGPVLWLLLFLFVVSCVLYLTRLMFLRRAQADGADFLRGVENVLARGNAEEALAVCDETPVPVADVTAAALRVRGDGPQAIAAAAESERCAAEARLVRRLAALAIIAQVSPMLGLFGAVAGFVNVLLALDAGTPVAQTHFVRCLAESLVPAAAGLAVGLVIQVMYGILRARLDRVLADLEAATLSVRALLADFGAREGSVP